MLKIRQILPRFALAALAFIVSWNGGLAAYRDGAAVAWAQAKDAQSSSQAIVKGQRVYSIGHSFHVFMPGILGDMVAKAELKDHVQVGMSAIGGSRVIQHWDVPDDSFKSKEALRSGKVDVLTIAPIFLPDDGIEKFVALALEHNPEIRVTLQENWLPFEVYTPPALQRVDAVDHNALTVEELHKRHTPYFESLDGQIKQLNQKHGKTVVYAVPVGQAIIALRAKIIAGEAPGLKTQDDLFSDPIGHAKPPLQALVAYCHYVVTYRRSPVGMPTPAILAARGNTLAANPALVKLLQELAWEAAVQHPLSGVMAE